MPVLTWRKRNVNVVMNSPEFLQSLAQPGTTKLVLFVFDGLGGLPRTLGGLTELETARAPNLDRFAAEGITGLSELVGPGVTPGSGPGHLALFGYDPVANNIGRGALSALGIGAAFGPGDVAARLNLCTVDAKGKVVDRRAGRISTEQNRELVAELNTIKVDGVSLEFITESQYRVVLVIRGQGLDPRVVETDPQATGVPPHAPEPIDPGAERTSQILKRILEGVRAKIGHRLPANFILMRGYAGLPHLPSFSELYGLSAACIAAYPMYKGLARAAGMTVLDTGDTITGEFNTLERAWADHDFFFFHVKPTDSKGEDGDFDGKVAVIEEVDPQLARIRTLRPDVLAVTGDHSTPAVLRQHSYHPVPFLMWGSHVRPDPVTLFGESACGQGAMGVFPARSIMGHMLAHASRLVKFGA